MNNEIENLSIEDRLSMIRERMHAACGRCGRDPSEVGLLAVSKTRGPDVIRAAAEAGLTVFGENRVQEARAKIPECPGHLEWHLIGHLQRNKLRHAVELFSMVHSVDSLQLLEQMERVCEERGKTLPVCLQVNVSGEASKFGMTPEELPGVLEATTGFTRVEVVGLMTIPPASADLDKTRRHFAALRTLKEKCAGPGGFPMQELSMGMSYDFEAAIEEGSTWIRVGSDLFGPRK